ncbi:hypothetical protein KR093_004924 [Drosophila rubida]|uniref:Uncharacterized protein n=1 Tax=Drosophila rubida TaxID=30044 RepID=A0AAD4JV18_9MUSC|nr:hypothetical protein KR093_004924 [Drosophila rubida]
MMVKYEELVQKYAELDMQKEEEIAHLKHELSKMMEKFEKLLKKDCELNTQNNKRLHDKEEITYLEQEQESKATVKKNSETVTENAKCLHKKEDEIDHLNHQLTKVKLKE